MGVYRCLAGAVLGRHFEFQTDQRIAPTSRVRRTMGLKEKSSKLGDVFFVYRRTEPNHAPVVPATCACLRLHPASAIRDVVMHKPTTARQFADVQLNELGTRVHHYQHRCSVLQHRISNHG
jgi:hypothetical protein